MRMLLVVHLGRRLFRNRSLGREFGFFSGGLDPTYLFMRESSGGFAFSGCRISGVDFFHSGVTVAGFIRPLKYSVARFSLMIGIACISRKASVASRPAYFRITTED